MAAPNFLFCFCNSLNCPISSVPIRFYALGQVGRESKKEGLEEREEGEEEGFHPYNFPSPSPFFKLLPRVKTVLQKKVKVFKN